MGKIAGICGLLSLLSWAPSVASAQQGPIAEWAFDLFLGRAFTEDTAVDLSAGGATVRLSEEFDDALLVGGRLVYWWGFAGLGLDVSHFEPDPQGALVVSGVDPNLGLITGSLRATDAEVFAIAAPILFRLRFLDGKLQPYVWGAPALFVSEVKLKAAVNFVTQGLAFTASDSDTDVSFGVSAGAGLTFMFAKNIGAFSEYRFSHFSPSYRVFSDALKVEADVNVHQLLAGVTFRF